MSVTHTMQIDRTATVSTPDHLTKNYWSSKPCLRHLLTSGTETPPGHQHASGSPTTALPGTYQ